MRLSIRLSMKLLPMALASALTMSLPSHAHANIFDPILKVLLPFYDGDTPDQSENDNNTTSPNNSDDPSPKNTNSNNASSHNTGSNVDNIDNQDPSDLTTDNSSTQLSSAQLSKIQAEEDQLQANKAKPEPNLYSLLQAEFAIDRGNPQQALNLYKEQAFTRDATAVFERALAMSLKYEEPEQSLAFASKWYQQNPDHVPAWFYVAHLALQAHDYDLAGETLQRILQYDPQADLSQILQDIFPEAENDQQSLLITLQQLNNTENANLSILQAGLLLKNEPEIALVHANRALKSDPDNITYIVLKADILKQLPPPKKLLKFIKKSRKRLPEEQQLYLYEVRYRLNELSPMLDESDQEENNEKALQLLLEASERFSDDPEIILLASLVSLDNEEYDTGERLLQDLLERPAYVDKANYYLAISAERQHRYQDAKAYFAQVKQEDLALEACKKVVAYELLFGDDDLTSDSVSSSANSSTANTENHSSNHSDNNLADNSANNSVNRAIQALIDLRNNFPVYAVDSYLLQSEILLQQDATAQVTELLSEAYASYPEDIQISFAYAKLLDNHADYDKKYHLLENLLATDEDNTDYQLEFAKLLLSKNPSSSQGKRLAKQLANIPQDSPNFAPNQYIESATILAQASLENQEYQQAIDYLQKPYNDLPNLTTGLLLLQAYQGLDDNKNKQLAKQLQNELQKKFAYQPISTDDTDNIGTLEVESNEPLSDKQMSDEQPTEVELMPESISETPKPFVPNL